MFTNWKMLRIVYLQKFSKLVLSSWFVGPAFNFIFSIFIDRDVLHTSSTSDKLSFKLGHSGQSNGIHVHNLSNERHINLMSYCWPYVDFSNKPWQLADFDIRTVSLVDKTRCYDSASLAAWDGPRYAGAQYFTLYILCKYGTLRLEARESSTSETTQVKTAGPSQPHLFGDCRITLVKATTIIESRVIVHEKTGSWWFRTNAEREVE